MACLPLSALPAMCWRVEAAAMPGAWYGCFVSRCGFLFFSDSLQSARPFPNDGSLLDPALHPLWAAGITGRGQVIGCGDSGLGERQRCQDGSTLRLS